MKVRNANFIEIRFCKVIEVSLSQREKEDGQKGRKNIKSLQVVFVNIKSLQEGELIFFFVWCKVIFTLTLWRCIDINGTLLIETFASPTTLYIPYYNYNFAFVFLRITLILQLTKALRKGIITHKFILE